MKRVTADDADSGPGQAAHHGEAGSTMDPVVGCTPRGARDNHGLGIGCTTGRGKQHMDPVAISRRKSEVKVPRLYYAQFMCTP